MNVIDKCSNNIAGYITNELNMDSDHRENYRFALQIILGFIVKYLVLIIVGLLFHILIPIIIISAVFKLMRYLAGGYHMDTYFKCLFVSMCLFTVAASISQYTFSYWNIAAFIILHLFTLSYGLYVLVKYAPKDTPNKPLRDARKRIKFKVFSIAFLFLMLLLSAVLVIYGLKMYAIALNLGLLLELFVITPTGHRFFDWVRTGLNKTRADSF